MHRTTRTGGPARRCRHGENQPGRLKLGRPSKSISLVGLRGVGKTVLLDQIRRGADAAGSQTIRIEAPEDRSLPALLAPPLRLALLHLSRTKAAQAVAIRGLRALAGFAGKLKLKFHDIEVGLDYDPEPGLADNGDLESDLGALFMQIGAAAKAAKTALAIFIDELQYVEETQMAALISACTAVRRSAGPSPWWVPACRSFAATWATSNPTQNGSSTLRRSVRSAHRMRLRPLSGRS
jgi:hypothetical protein